MTTATVVITANSFLTLHYRLCSLDGVDIINTFKGKPATLTLGTGQLSHVLEGYLLGLGEDAHETFVVPANSPHHAPAFGHRNPDLIQWVAKHALKSLGDKDQSYAVGDVVQFPTPDGQATYAGAVQTSSANAVRFDFNHPLAGQAVRFEVRISSIL